MVETTEEDGAAWPVRTAEGEATSTATAAATAWAEEGDDRGDEAMVKARCVACEKWQIRAVSKANQRALHRQQTMAQTSPDHS